MINYIPVLLLIAVAVGLGTVVIILTSLLGPRRPNAMKSSVYECGVPPVGDAKRRVSVKFYLVAILFLLFDVEAVFFYPWAISFKEFLKINSFILFEMLFFVLILFVGYVYILKKGALDWD
jgi:NADH-quinone oxidoreductase subunit A